MEQAIARLIIYACCVVLVVVPFYFIGHQVYKDGVFGRWSLSWIIFCAVAVLVEGVFKPLAGRASDPDVILWAVVGLVAGFTTFLVWHLCRWHRRVLNPRSDPLPSRAEVQKQTPSLLKASG